MCQEDIGRDLWIDHRYFVHLAEHTDEVLFLKLKIAERDVDVVIQIRDTIDSVNNVGKKHGCKTHLASDANNTCSEQCIVVNNRDCIGSNGELCRIRVVHDIRHHLTFVVGKSYLQPSLRIDHTLIIRCNEIRRQCFTRTCNVIHELTIVVHVKYLVIQMGRHSERAICIKVIQDMQTCIEWKLFEVGYLKDLFKTRHSHCFVS